MLDRQGSHFKLRIPKAEASQVTARLLNELRVSDLTVEDPPVEDVIEKVFTQKSIQGETL